MASWDLFEQEVKKEKARGGVIISTDSQGNIVSVREAGTTVTSNINNPSGKSVILNAQSGTKVYVEGEARPVAEIQQTSEGTAISPIMQRQEVTGRAMIPGDGEVKMGLSANSIFYQQMVGGEWVTISSYDRETGGIQLNPIVPIIGGVPEYGGGTVTYPQTRDTSPQIIKPVNLQISKISGQGEGAGAGGSGFGGSLFETQPVLRSRQESDEWLGMNPAIAEQAFARGGAEIEGALTAGDQVGQIEPMFTEAVVSGAQEKFGKGKISEVEYNIKMAGAGIVAGLENILKNPIPRVEIGPIAFGSNKPLFTSAKAQAGAMGSPTFLVGMGTEAAVEAVVTGKILSPILGKLSTKFPILERGMRSAGVIEDVQVAQKVKNLAEIDVQKLSVGTEKGTFSKTVIEPKYSYELVSPDQRIVIPEKVQFGVEKITRGIMVKPEPTLVNIQSSRFVNVPSHLTDISPKTVLEVTNMGGPRFVSSSHTIAFPIKGEIPVELPEGAITKAIPANIKHTPFTTQAMTQAATQAVTRTTTPVSVVSVTQPVTNIRLPPRLTRPRSAEYQVEMAYPQQVTKPMGYTVTGKPITQVNIKVPAVINVPSAISIPTQRSEEIMKNVQIHKQPQNPAQRPSYVPAQVTPPIQIPGQVDLRIHIPTHDLPWHYQPPTQPPRTPNTFTPPTGIPISVPFQFPSGGQRRSFRFPTRYQRRGSYQPSLTALFRGFSVSKTPRNLTGLEVRPVVGGIKTPNFNIKMSSFGGTKKKRRKR